MSEKKKRTLHHYRRRILIGVLGCVAVLILLAVAWPTIRLLYWQWQLNQAQQRWEQNEPDHYRYHVMGCHLYCYHTFITIRDDEIIEAFVQEDYPEPSELEPITDLNTIEGQKIENYFSYIAKRFYDNNFLSPSRVNYDSYYGYPTEFFRHLCDFGGTTPSDYCGSYQYEHHILDFEVLSNE